MEASLTREGKESKDSEPYCIVRWLRTEKKTKSSKNATNPQWNEEFNISVEFSVIFVAKLEIIVQDKASAVNFQLFFIISKLNEILRKKIKTWDKQLWIFHS